MISSFFKTLLPVGSCSSFGLWWPLVDLFITTDRGWKFGRGDLITAGSCPHRAPLIQPQQGRRGVPVTAKGGRMARWAVTVLLGQKFLDRVFFTFLFWLMALLKLVSPLVQAEGMNELICKSLCLFLITVMGSSCKLSGLKTTQMYCLPVLWVRNPARLTSVLSSESLKGKIRVSSGWVLSGGSGEESAAKHVQIVGWTQFLVLVGLGVPFPCCLSAGGQSCL